MSRDHARALVTLAVVLIAVVTLSAQDAFRARVDVVSVDVGVKDGKSPIKGLTSRDFVLLDDGVRQEIDAVSVDRLPIDVTLVLDVSGSVDGQTLQGLKGARDGTDKYKGRSTKYKAQRPSRVF